MTRGLARMLIERELAQRGPFFQNTIAKVLASIAKRYGAADANKIIGEFRLAELGWKPLQPRRGYRSGAI